MNRERRYLFRLPGGAAHGLLTLLTLAQLEKRLNQHIEKQTGDTHDLPLMAFLKPQDIILADSVGSIIAGIICKSSAQQGVDIFLQCVHKIIPPGRTLPGSLARRSFWRTAGLSPTDTLGNLLKQSLGDMTLRDYPTSILINSLELYPAPCMIAHYLNLHDGVLRDGEKINISNIKNGDSLLCDAIRASAAEPFFVGAKVNADSLEVDAAHTLPNASFIRELTDDARGQYTYVSFGNGHENAPIPPEEYLGFSRFRKAAKTLTGSWFASVFLYLESLAKNFPPNQFIVIDKNMLPQTAEERAAFPTDRSYDTSAKNIAKMRAFHVLMMKENEQHIGRLAKEIGDRYLGINLPAPTLPVAARPLPVHARARHGQSYFTPAHTIPPQYL